MFWFIASLHFCGSQSFEAFYGRSPFNEERPWEKYVGIGDIWTIFAGEMIVGLNNSRAYYFGEYNKTGHDLFVNMTRNTSSQWMLLAMNYNATTAYSNIEKPRQCERCFRGSN